MMRRRHETLGREKEREREKWDTNFTGTTVTREDGSGRRVAAFVLPPDLTAAADATQA